jgi:hypothetical protein
MNPLHFLADWLNGTTPVPNVTPLVSATLTVTDTSAPNNPYTYSGWANLVTPGSPESALQVTLILVAGSSAPYGLAQFTAQLLGVVPHAIPVPKPGGGGKPTAPATPFVAFQSQPIFSGAASPIPAVQIPTATPVVIMNSSGVYIQLQFNFEYNPPGPNLFGTSYICTLFLEETGHFIKVPKRVAVRKAP